jgi:hypothetical protein
MKDLLRFQQAMRFVDTPPGTEDSAGAPPGGQASLQLCCCTSPDRAFEALWPAHASALLCAPLRCHPCPLCVLLVCAWWSGAP